MSNSVLPNRGTRTGGEVRASEAGFSMVELLLAIGISAVLFTSMFWALDQIVRSRNGLSNRATPYTIGPAILDRIAADLSNAYWYDFADNNSFFGQDASLLGREADALSFVSLSKAIAPDKDLEGPDPDYPGRYSWANEIAFVCKQGRGEFLELWRREDFYVDDHPHSDGDYVLLYDRVHSITFRYIGRTPTIPEGGEEQSTATDGSELVRDGWDPVKERGIPKAVLVIIEIAAQDQYSEFGDPEQIPRIYSFQRFVPLPQVHLSTASQDQIANWDGTMNEAAPATTANVNNPAQNAVGGAGGRGQQGGRPGGQQGARPPTRGAAGATGGNPFLQALQGAVGGAPRGGGGAGGGLGALFGGAGRR